MSQDTENVSKELQPRELAAGEILKSVDPATIGSPAKVVTPNIKFVAKVQNPKFIDKKETPKESEWIAREPPAKLTIGKLVFEMPAADVQLQGFFDPEAHLIVRTFPRLYKRLVGKGVE